MKRKLIYFLDYCSDKTARKRIKLYSKRRN